MEKQKPITFEEFKELYDKLNDKNKEHLKATPIMQTEEDVRFVYSVMKFMYACQVIEAR